LGETRKGDDATVFRVNASFTRSAYRATGHLPSVPPRQARFQA
jgi:hypothetical protein